MQVAGCRYNIKRLAGLLLIMTAVLLSAGQAFAAFNVNISGNPSTGGSWAGTSPDVWTPDGTGANVSVAEIRARLNSGTGVTIRTGDGGSDAGNINVNAATAWNTGELTLTAHNDININAVMSASGPAGLAMNYGWNGTTYGNQGGLKVGFAPGEANGFAGRVDFPDSGLLTINGDSYTVIKNVFELQLIAGTSGTLAGKYALGVDIDASATAGWDGGAGFLPIGENFEKSFVGVFDGLGHKVTGLVINRPSINNVGLFGYSLNAIIRNVGVVGGNVSGSSLVGGLAGYIKGVVINCYNSGIVSGIDAVGGLAGYNDAAAIADSYSTGAVNGSSVVGGLVGMNYGSIINSFATGNVTGTTDSAGGLAGLNLLGGNISNSYATGSVNGSMSVGGFVGQNVFSTITNSYSTGSVNGTTDVGGLVGFNDSTPSITNSFWDTLTSGQEGSAGGTGKTTVEMKQPATFVTAGWSIDYSSNSNTLWSITEGQTYPLLRTFVPPQSIAASGAATGITTNGATLNGTVNALYADAEVSFQYGLTTAYGMNTAASPATVIVGSGLTAVSAVVSGLTPGQTYHCRVVASNSAGTVYGDDIVFTVQQLTQTISGFSPPSTAAYGDGPITLSAAATSSSTVSFSVVSGPGRVTGNQLTITGVGTISLQASQSGSLSYLAAPNVTASIVVGKATAAVTLGNLSQTYNGSSKTVTATTVPGSLVTVITYNGSPAEPTEIGSYAVTATISDINYHGTASGTLVINPPTLTVAVTANGAQPGGTGGTITSSPAGISCANSAGGTLVTCTGSLAGTVNLYATPYALSTFGGWGGGACSGLGPCSITMSADKTVTATFNQATLLQIGGSPYATLQEAYNAVSVSEVIQLLDNSVAGTLNANKNVTVALKGGYDTGYAINTGTTTLTAPLTVQLGSVIIDRIVIK